MLFYDYWAVIYTLFSYVFFFYIRSLVFILQFIFDTLSTKVKKSSVGEKMNVRKLFSL